MKKGKYQSNMPYINKYKNFNIFLYNNIFHFFQCCRLLMFPFYIHPLAALFFNVVATVDFSIQY